MYNNQKEYGSKKEVLWVGLFFFFAFLRGLVKYGYKGGGDQDR